MPSFQSFLTGFVLFIAAITVGIVMSWCVGGILDGFYSNELNGQPLVSDSLLEYAASPVYDDMAGLGVVTYYVNLFYALCYFLPLMGAIMFYQSIFRDASQETYGIESSVSVRRKPRW